MFTDCSGQEISKQIGYQIIQSGTVEGLGLDSPGGFLDLSCCRYPGTDPGTAVPFKQPGITMDPDPGPGKPPHPGTGGSTLRKKPVRRPIRRRR